MACPLKSVGALGAAAAFGMLGIRFDWFSTLSAQAILALCILLFCIILWIAKVFPEFLTALIMTALFIGVCGVPTETALSAFASPTWWLLVAAFGLGLGMQRSGLLSRMAAGILRLFPATFHMQAAGLIAAGTLIGPFIPSLSAKATMLAPLSMQISDSMGYERKGREANGLFLAMFTGIRTVGPAVISASIIGYGLVATLPTEVAARFDLIHWFVAMLPWFAMVTILNYLAIVILYGPRRRAHASSGAPEDSFESNPDDVGTSALPTGLRANATEAKEPFSVHEREMLIIMAGCILLWITEPVHGVESHIVALGAFICMMACGVISPKELRQNIAWDSLIFIGCVLGLASVFSFLGIDQWLIASCEPVFLALSSNIYLLIASIGIITVLLRFVIVSEMAYINLFMAFMVPLAMSVGVNPWVIGVSVYVMVNPWFVLYQNPIYLTAYYATDGKMVRQSSMARYCAVYMIICLAALMASIPYWQGIGVL